jgi:hypothetical protein
MSEFEKVKEAILMWIDGLDAINTKLRRDLGADPFKKGSAKLQFDVAKIVWTPANDKPDQEYAFPDKNSGNKDYENLQIFLRSAGGRITSEGKFMWLFQDDKTVGRKDAKQK